MTFVMDSPKRATRSKFLPMVIGAAYTFAAPASADVSWVGPTVDESVTRAFHAASKATDARDAMAAIVWAAHLSELSTVWPTQVTLGKQPPKGIESVAWAVFRNDADNLLRAASETTSSEDSLRATYVIGPYRDLGAGLALTNGPEDGTRAFGDLARDDSWGSVHVRWHALPPWRDSLGVPLNLLVSPRAESCSWVARAFEARSTHSGVLAIAGSGQLRAVLDGHTIGLDEANHRRGWFSRIVREIEFEAGKHWVAVKSCTGTQSDDGSVRVLLRDRSGAKNDDLLAPIPLEQARTVAASRVIRSVRAVVEHVLSAADKPSMRAAEFLVRASGADDLSHVQAPSMLAELLKLWATLPSWQRVVIATMASSELARAEILEQLLADKALLKEERALVQLLVIRSRFDARQFDWAIAGFESLPPELKKQPAAVLLGARAYAATSSPTSMARAFRLLEAPLLRAGDRLRAELANGLSPEQATLSAERVLSRALHHPSFLVLYGKKPKEALALIDERYREGAFDLRDVTDVAEALIEVGHAMRARGWLLELVALSPNESALWRLLSKAAMHVHEPGQRAGDEQQVRDSLLRAQELDPADAQLRAMLTAGGATKAARDERFLASDAEVRKSRLQALPNEAKSVDLFWRRIVTKHDDRRVSQLIHYARQIGVAPRTNEELEESLPLEGEQNELLRARVWRKDGSVAYPREERRSSRGPLLRWPELDVGDTVEVALRSWTAGPVGGRGDVPYYFIDYVGSTEGHPLLENRVVVDMPENEPLFLDTSTAAPDERQEKRERGRIVTDFVWRKLRVVPEEPLAPPLSETLPVVVGSTFRDWAAFRDWYREAVKGFTIPDAEVHAIAQELTRGKQSTEEKMDALFKFVADQIRYVNYVSAEAWLPNRPHEVLARREGDCDDKAILLISLLKAIGVDASEVLVQTRLSGRSTLLKLPNAAVPMFDHGIAFVPSLGGGTYLDATSPQARMGPLPSMDGRALALRIDDPNPALVTLPTADAKRHGTSIRWEIALNTSGDARLEAHEDYSGDAAFRMRTYAGERSQRRDFVRHQSLQGIFPTSDIEGEPEFDGELPNGGARLRYRANLRGAARSELGGWLMSFAPRTPWVDVLAPRATRQLPVVLPPELAPMSTEVVWLITAPKGMDWISVPVSGVADGGSFGRAEMRVAKPRSDLLEIYRRTVLDKHVISPVEYPEWRAWLVRVSSLFSAFARAQARKQ